MTIIRRAARWRRTTARRIVSASSVHGRDCSRSNSLDDPTAADAKLRALAPGAAAFTLASAQPKSLSGFDPTTMIGAAPESNEGAGPDEAAFDSAKAAGRSRGPRHRQLPGLAARARRAEGARRGTRSLAWLRSTARRGRWRARRDARRRAAERAGIRERRAGAPPTSRRPKAFDASEGTALDPLRDKSWDLTSAKNVPAIVNPR